MEQANVDLNEIAKDLYMSYNSEPAPGENVPYFDSIDRMTMGMEVASETIESIVSSENEPKLEE